MPNKYIRRNQNNNGYIISGQFHSEKEIKELKERIKLEEKLLKIKKEHANAEKAINDALEAGIKLKDFDNQMSEKELKQAKKLVSEYSKMQKSDIFKPETTRQNIDSLVSKANSSSSVQLKSLSDWYNASQSAKQRQEAESIYNKVLNSVYKKYSKSGADLNDERVRSLMMQEVNDKASEKIGKAADKYGKFSGVMDAVGKVFSKAVETFKNVIETQTGQQVGVYESNFRIVSVREGLTRGNWYQGQNSAKDLLDEQNLFNNIDTTEVMEMWATLSKNGVLKMNKDGTIDQSNAIETVITQTIVPYLDMTSVYMQQLTDTLGPSFTKQIRGITRATEDIYGSSAYANKYLQHILTDLGPVATYAEQEVGIQAAKSIGIYQGLSNAGLSEKAISEIGNQVDSIMNNTYEALANGTTETRNTVSDMMRDHADLNDASEVLKYYLQNLNKYSNLITENGNMSSIGAGVLNSTGTIATSASTIQEMNKLNINVDNILTNTDKLADKVDEYGEQALKDLGNDINNTQKELQDNTVSNWFTWWAQLKEMLGEWWPVISTLGSVIVGGITTYLGGKFAIGALGKAITGTAASTAATSTAVGTAGAAGGSTVLGSIGGVISAIAPIAVAVAAIAAVNGAVQAANKSSEEYGAEAGAADVAGTKYESSEAVKALMSSAETIADRGGLQNGWNNMTSGIGYGFSKIFQGKADNNKNLTQWIMSSDTFGTDPSNLAARIAIWGIMMDQAGYFNKFKDGMKEAGANDWGDAKVDDLVELLVDNGWKKSDINSWANNIIKAGWKPYLNNGKRMESFDFNSSKYGLEGVEGFRYGLNNVPYDDYLAYLHEGEAVLTSSTANELRNLLDEYRTMNTQSINFDAIIQQQTTDLISKMDEIIHTMQSNHNLFTNSMDNQKARDLLSGSLTHIKSTKSF